VHHSEPLVETFLRKMSLRTFREFQQPSKLAFPNHFFIILKNNHITKRTLNPISPKKNLKFFQSESLVDLGRAGVSRAEHELVPNL
jgi:hypothetical protein